MVFLVVLALLVAKQVKGDIPVIGNSCDAVLNACEASEASCQELVKAQRELVGSQDNMIVKLTKQRNEALEMVKPEASMPWYIWTVVGIAGGVILTRGIR